MNEATMLGHSHQSGDQNPHTLDNLIPAGCEVQISHPAGIKLPIVFAFFHNIMIHRFKKVNKYSEIYNF